MTKDQNIEIATWNINPWNVKSPGGPEVAWDYIIDQLGCDILLFQEGEPPDSISQRADHFLGIQTRAGMVGIYAPKFRVQPISRPNPLAKQYWVVGSVEIPGQAEPLIAISVYGLMDEFGPIANLQAMLSELTPVLLAEGTLKPKSGVKIVMGGDLNASPQWDENYYRNKQRPHGLFFDRVADHGLKSAFDLAGFDDYIQTLRSPNSDKPWQNDYLFVSQALAKSFQGCEIIDNETVRSTSDHNIVIVHV